MSLGRQILQASDEELLEQLQQCEPTSVMWSGITDELQRRRLLAMRSVLERSEALSKAFTTQLEQLITIADAQKTLALKLDKDTGILLKLTRTLVWLTIVLLLFTAYLCYDAYEKSESHNLTEEHAANQK